jgi:tRNA (cytidine/uridine-2'-O-)-methyltransferase
MFNIALLHPQIPANTGNIIRLCANTGSTLHLIQPLGFTLDDKRMQRAGLDYHEYANLQVHINFETFLEKAPNSRLFAIETCGQKNYSAVAFQPGDILLFGAETFGIPTTILSQIPPDNILKIPMRENNRSLNLSNSVALVVYEAWKQVGYVT